MSGRIPRRDEIDTAFTPAQPVGITDLFAGRIGQLNMVSEALKTPGLHIIVFGERGVGKTSLANIVPPLARGLTGTLVAPRYNCTNRDSFTSMWIGVLQNTLDALDVNDPIQEARARIIYDVLSGLDDVDCPPSDLISALRDLAREMPLLFVFDEFDRIALQSVRSGMADTIKALSDYHIEVTIMIVGVADDVSDLIREHESVERNLQQVLMKRMSDEEIWDLLQKGAGKIGMTFEDDSKRRITSLSRGLPHYAHLLGLHACREAVDSRRSTVTVSDVEKAIQKAIEAVQNSIQVAYEKAVYSPKETIYAQVLAACALAECSELGWFSASAVKKPLSDITGRDYDIPGFARHLSAFCTEDRAYVLQRDGKRNQYRYRFRNPLMQPYAVMKAFPQGRLPL